MSAIYIPPGPESAKAVSPALEPTLLCGVLDPDPAAIAQVLERDPITSLIEKRALARLLSSVRVRWIGAGATIFAQGAHAAELFFSLAGPVEIIIPNRPPFILEGNRFGEDAALANGRYALSARTPSGVTVLAVPRAALAAALIGNADARNAFEVAVLNRLSGLSASSPPRLSRSVDAAPTSREILGWLLTILVPIAMVLFAPRDVVGRDAVLFLAIFGAAVCLWGFGLVSRRSGYDGLVYPKNGKFLWRDEQVDAASDAGLLVDESELVEGLEHLVN